MGLEHLLQVIGGGVSCGAVPPEVRDALTVEAIGQAALLLPDRRVEAVRADHHSSAGGDRSGAPPAMGAHDRGPGHLLNGSPHRLCSTGTCTDRFVVPSHGSGVEIAEPVLDLLRGGARLAELGRTEPGGTPNGGEVEQVGAADQASSSALPMRRRSRFLAR